MSHFVSCTLHTQRFSFSTSSVYVNLITIFASFNSAYYDFVFHSETWVVGLHDNVYAPSAESDAKKFGREMRNVEQQREVTETH